MQVYYSQYSRLVPHHFKAVSRLDKASQQRPRIFSQGEPPQSIMSRRVSHIQKELIDLSDNRRLYNYLAYAHYLLYDLSRDVPLHGLCRCQDTAYAVIQRNLFDHKLFRAIDSLERCELELQDNEEGTFLVRIPQRYFVKECKAHFDLTGVYPGRLKGFSPPYHNLLEAACFGRSSNIAFVGKKTMSLGKFEDGELAIPEEWRQIPKELRE